MGWRAPGAGGEEAQGVSADLEARPQPVGELGGGGGELSQGDGELQLPDAGEGVEEDAPLRLELGGGGHHLEGAAPAPFPVRAGGGAAVGARRLDLLELPEEVLPLVRGDAEAHRVSGHRPGDEHHAAAEPGHARPSRGDALHPGRGPGGGAFEGCLHAVPSPFGANE